VTVFLLEPSRTQFDLNWRMFGIPVRVHPMFWLTAILLGWSGTMDRHGVAMTLGMAFLLVWVACVFVSILVHELGHVVMGQLFGTRGHIVLYGFGGLAVGSNALSNRWKRIAVCFAGPLAGFVLLGLVVGILVVLVSQHWLVQPEGGANKWEAQPFVLEAFSDLIEINLFWGLVNLLPIWPLDGGQISRDVFGWVMPRSGTRVSLVVSGIVAGLIALNALATHFGKHPFPILAFGDLWMAIFFGLLCVSSFMTLQQVSQQQRYQRQEESDRMPWERDPDYWKSGRDADHDYWER
jgi:Zn-dependent protease